MWASTPDEGREVVGRYKAAGFQEIKIYSLVTPDVVKAVAEAAHAAGLMVTGHVPAGHERAAGGRSRIRSGRAHADQRPARLGPGQRS